MKENEQSIRIISYPVLNDFRKVRISFTANEVDQYVRSLWAYELWVKAGKPVPVANVKEIPKDMPLVRMATSWFSKTAARCDLGIALLRFTDLNWKNWSAQTCAQSS